eukprot:gb/GFBE01024424.1/.p1 GENE.gb/GFBE01024424.1/~~gb/GFBE01024424.1/.p1  ORF type:complete len:323 (+),score=46.66 gb/GFBE01024424.1/:1-969(+)
MGGSARWSPSHKVSLVPAVMRNDPCLAGRPQLRRGMEDWWAGSLWDPREPEHGDTFVTDFTCDDSIDGVLDALHTRSGEYEPLSAAVASGDLSAATRLLTAGAKATPALHLALQSHASPEAVSLLATWSDDLNVWLPEPVVVTWARSFCDAVLSSQGAARRRRGATDRLDAVLGAGADINAVGRGCETALHVLARKLQEVAEEAPKNAAAKLRHAEVVEALRKGWHDLVARGADAGMLDGDGLTAVERLSRSQCCDLLASKRNAYARKRYSDARLRGQDPSQSWFGSDCLQSISQGHSPIPPVVSASRSGSSSSYRSYSFSS